MIGEVVFRGRGDRPRHDHPGPAGPGQTEFLGGGKVLGQLVEAGCEPGRVEPVVGVGGGRFTQDVGQRPQAVMARELGAHAGHQRRDGGVGGEGDDAGDRFVENQGERVDVSPTIDAVAERLLGRGIPGRAHRRPRRLGQRRLGQCPGETEVSHTQPPLLVEEQVGGLHVAMDEPTGVRIGEPLGGLGPDGNGLGQAQTGPLVEHVPQRPPAEELEHEERTLLVLAPVVDRQHVRVGQRGRGLCLGPEPAEEAAVGGQRRVQDLDGHTTLQCRVERREHVRRRPASECSLDPVAAGKDPTDGFGNGRHGPHPGY